MSTNLNRKNNMSDIADQLIEVPAKSYKKKPVKGMTAPKIKTLQTRKKEMNKNQYKQAVANHKAAISKIKAERKKLKQDIKKHKLLIKQAKIVYKVTQMKETK
jgi:hypothetical protein